MSHQATQVDSPSQSIVEYRAIPGFPGYRAGTDGTIWSQHKQGPGIRYGPWHQLRPKTCRDGYCTVTLSANYKQYTRLVQRLVLMTFIGPCPPGHEACHAPDPARNNNRLDNLRWGTRSSNVQDKLQSGRHPRGIRMPQARLTDDKVREILDIRRTQGLTFQALSVLFEVSIATIHRVVSRKCWAHVPYSQ